MFVIHKFKAHIFHASEVVLITKTTWNVCRHPLTSRYVSNTPPRAAYADLKVTHVDQASVYQLGAKRARRGRL